MSNRRSQASPSYPFTSKYLVINLKQRLAQPQSLSKVPRDVLPHILELLLDRFSTWQHFSCGVLVLIVSVVVVVTAAALMALYWPLDRRT